MDQLLTLEEAAKLLNVDYKSVYRLVRTGQLKAGRIGRVYRIALPDLDAFFERSKQRVELDARPAPPNAAAGPWTCCITGRTFISALDFGGWSNDKPSLPICHEAWAAGHRSRQPTPHPIP